MFPKALMSLTNMDFTSMISACRSLKLLQETLFSTHWLWLKLGRFAVWGTWEKVTKLERELVPHDFAQQKAGPSWP